MSTQSTPTSAPTPDAASDARPRHLAIAGAWGYIGRKFIDAALDLGWQLSVYDPGPAPADLPAGAFDRCQTQDELYALDADLFHLALHPEHRAHALQSLLCRGGVAILNEKPMAAPDHPEECGLLLKQLAASDAAPSPILLFDFPELFDPVTTRILDFLQQFNEVQIDDIFIQRSKDREARDNPRNTKRMVHIQYQETVHCIAFLLFLLGRLRGTPETLLDDGVVVEGQSEPYDPPNPVDYPFVVDGKAEFEWTFGSTQVKGCTDFKAGAPFRKQRVLRGHGDGQPWQIDVDYLEGAKSLRIDGVDQHVDAAGSSYEGVLQTLEGWVANDRDQLMSSTRYPNAHFARLTYSLSGLLWRSCYEGRALSVASTTELLEYDAGFAAASEGFARYS